jgi:hypothetical protein
MDDGPRGDPGREQFCVSVGESNFRLVKKCKVLGKKEGADTDRDGMI